MTIVSDTACLSALARIGRMDILQALFGSIVLPYKVFEELLALQHFGVDIGIFTQSDWLEVKEPGPSKMLSNLLAINKIDQG